MRSPLLGSRTKARWNPRRAAVWTGLIVGSLMPTVGCQVEYAGMTLPSGKYMRDDVQYFTPGPDFPWANTQAATQRARMQAMGIDPLDGGVNGRVPNVRSDMSLSAPYGTVGPAVGAGGGIPGPPDPLLPQNMPGNVPAPPAPGAVAPVPPAPK